MFRQRILTIALLCVLAVPTAAFAVPTRHEPDGAAVAALERCHDQGCRAFVAAGSGEIPDAPASRAEEATLTSGRMTLFVSAWSAERQTRCLALAATSEAIGEPGAGQTGVMNVILNRMRTETAPDACRELTEPHAFFGVRQPRYHAPYAALRRGRMIPPLTARAPADRAAIRRILAIAWNLVHGADVDVTHGAVYFWTPVDHWKLTHEHPRWISSLVLTAVIGGHEFLKPGKRPATKAAGTVRKKRRLG